MMLIVGIDESTKKLQSEVHYSDTIVHCSLSHLMPQICQSFRNGQRGVDVPSGHGKAESKAQRRHCDRLSATKLLNGLELVVSLGKCISSADHHRW